MLRSSHIITSAGTVPPGPCGYPLVGVLPMLLRNPLQLLTSVAAQYGDVVSLPVGPQRFYLLNHPDHFKHVLLDHYRNYHKGANFTTFKRLVGQGLGMSEGDFWLRQRRLAQPAFHHQRLAALATMMTDATAAMIELWQTAATDGNTLDIADEMRRLTQQIIVKTMFSSAIAHETEAVCHAFDVALAHITRSFWMSALPARLIPGNQKFEQAVQTLDTVVYRIIEERRHDGNDPGDLLTMLLQAHDAETGEGMSDRQVRDEIMTMFLAGHETTSNALTWTFHLLAQHPEVERQLQAEIIAALGDRIPTFQDIPRLIYTRMVIEEALRLYPVAWVIFRTPLTDDVIGGFHIPARSVVMLCPYVLHRTPAFWEQPEHFDPERFTSARSSGRSRYAYIPFGGGPRQCIGNAFALMEMQLILAMVLQRYRLCSVPGHPVEPHIAITLQPRYGMRMAPQARSSQF
jgi:cytochrome P450